MTSPDLKTKSHYKHVPHTQLQARDANYENIVEESSRGLENNPLMSIFWHDCIAMTKFHCLVEHDLSKASLMYNSLLFFEYIYMKTHTHANTYRIF